MKLNNPKLLGLSLVGLMAFSAGGKVVLSVNIMNIVPKKITVKKYMKQIMKFKYLVIISLVLLSQKIAAQEVSKSFELRYFTKDAKANGETDFKGETEYFDTEQRVEYLNKYAEVAKQFFDDPNLDTKVVGEA